MYQKKVGNIGKVKDFVHINNTLLQLMNTNTSYKEHVLMSAISCIFDLLFLFLLCESVGGHLPNAEYDATNSKVLKALKKD